uniref:Thioredoxin domain-containing protein n=1 Tax=Syphacia muris TaxID=451379 RepID=A0A0N5AMA8_9BILA
MWSNLIITVALLCEVGIVEATSVPSDVIELNDRFLEVKDDGYWFVEFYAPWCAHCKRLMPIWEHVGHALADKKSLVRVGKLDCTRFSSVASALEIQSYPTVIFFRNGEKRIYEGERRKEAMVDFAVKGSGPVVGILKSFNQLSELRKSVNEPFFVYVSSGNTIAELYDEYSWLAGKLFWSRSFYRSAPDVLRLKNLALKLPTVVVFKDNEYSAFDYDKDKNLTKWINNERWPLMPLVTSSILRNIGSSRLLVLAVINKIDRRNESSPVGKFYSMITKVAHTVRTDLKLSRYYQFGWLDGNDLANNIVLNVVKEPDYLVINASSYEFYSSGDASSAITAKSIIVFLERIIAGDVIAQGGSSITQRIRRMFFEISSSLVEMFEAQPLLTICIFGLPLAFLSLVTYCLCSSDFSVDRDEVYPDDDDDTDISDIEDHEKAE